MNPSVAKTDKNSFDGSLQTKGAFFRKAGYELVQNQISDSAKRYLDPKTGEIDAVKTTERNCLVCGSAERRLLFKKNQFPKIVPWLMENRAGLTVFVHPNSGDSYGDHAHRPLWMGRVLRLRLAFLKNL